MVLQTCGRKSVRQCAGRTDEHILGPLRRTARAALSHDGDLLLAARPGRSLRSEAVCGVAGCGWCAWWRGTGPAERRICRRKLGLPHGYKSQPADSVSHKATILPQVHLASSVVPLVRISYHILSAVAHAEKRASGSGVSFDGDKDIYRALSVDRCAIQGQLDCNIA